VGQTVPAVCREAVGDILDIQGNLLQFLNGGTAVNACFYCTALQHLKEAVQMKQTLDPDFLSAGAEHVLVG
jgi:hypothetical protein